MKKTYREYVAPTAELIPVDAADLLTLSAGFDGEDQELPMP